MSLSHLCKIQERPSGLGVRWSQTDQSLMAVHIGQITTGFLHKIEIIPFISQVWCKTQKIVHVSYNKLSKDSLDSLVKVDSAF